MFCEQKMSVGKIPFSIVRTRKRKAVLQTASGRSYKTLTAKSGELAMSPLFLYNMR